MTRVHLPNIGKFISCRLDVVSSLMDRAPTLCPLMYQDRSALAVVVQLSAIVSLTLYLSRMPLMNGMSLLLIWAKSAGSHQV